MTALSVVAVTGNVRAASQTSHAAHAVATAVARAIDRAEITEIDLAPLGAALLDPDDPDAARAFDQVLEADVLVIASPTYKATYTGLLKLFLDRFPAGSFAGTPTVPVLLGGASDHRLALDVHLVPLLVELGACVPWRGLFILESELPDLNRIATNWVSSHGTTLQALVAAQDRRNREPDAQAEYETTAGAVRIVGHEDGHAGEAVIDRIALVGDRIRVELTLAAGERRCTSIDAEEWMWLDLRPGDIVAIRRAHDEGLSG